MSSCWYVQWNSELWAWSLKSLNRNRRGSEEAGTAGEPWAVGAFPSFRRPTGAGPRQRKSGVKVHSRGWRRDQEQSCVSALLQCRKEGGGPSGPLVYGWQRDDGNMEKYYHTLSLTYRSISVCRCIFFSTSPLVWSASEINTQKFICLTDLLGLPASFIIWILDSFVEIKSGKKKSLFSHLLKKKVASPSLCVWLYNSAVTCQIDYKHLD